jgi:hypothetical protein
LQSIPMMNANASSNSGVIDSWFIKCFIVLDSNWW